VARVLAALRQAEAAGADLAVFSELVLTGYPPEDLLLKPGFVADNLAALHEVAAATGTCAAVVGFVDKVLDLHNAAAGCAGGREAGTYGKRLLPNYAVFDEQRYFTPGAEPARLYSVAGVRVGVSICEDVWSPAGPMAAQAAAGAELVVNLSASPYHAGRQAERVRMLATRAADASCALVYVNQVGGQDELVFDGGSLLLDAGGAVVAAGPQFEEAVVVVDLEVLPSFRKRLLDPRGRAPAPALPTTEVSRPPPRRPPLRPPAVPTPLGPLLEIERALVTGTRDYVVKNGFQEVVIGLSGGIDSSLVAVLACRALSADRVHGVSMPSRFSSGGSVTDAKQLAGNLGIDHRSIPINPAHGAFLEMLAPAFAGRSDDLTEENVQARARGVVLMALSNKFGWLVLTTANKSELAVGYSTLYGDSAGGFAVIKDVPKTLVYRLARAINDGAGTDLIPDAVLAKPPSAELRPDQRDDDSLPPYEVLDPVLEAYVEGDRTAAELVDAGFPPDVVERVVALVDRAEYKRRQAPPGVRVTPKAFGKDRRVPITNRYRG
ncbi:MAG: NAD+ synthase, partial [Acidimicrobiales bacterium]